jgi:hypothetical protein
MKIFLEVKRCRSVKLHFHFYQTRWYNDTFLCKTVNISFTYSAFLRRAAAITSPSLVCGMLPRLKLQELCSFYDLWDSCSVGSYKKPCVPFPNHLHDLDRLPRYMTYCYTLLESTNNYKQRYLLFWFSKSCKCELRLSAL